MENQNYKIGQNVAIYYNNFKYECTVTYCDTQYVHLYVEFACAIVRRDFTDGDIIKLSIKDIVRGKYFDEYESKDSKQLEQYNDILEMYEQIQAIVDKYKNV